MNELKTILNNEAFLGRGWSFPPQVTDGGVRMSAYEQDIEESLRVLFSTSPGERVNRYDYGWPLRFRADNHGNHRADAQRHHKGHHPL